MADVNSSTRIEDVLPLQNLHLYDEYDLIMPTFVDERRLDYDMGEKCEFPVHVGHGAFGDVFRVRFKDNRCKDTKICIKELSEKYNSRHDVIEEARKLLYLSDTGYAPLCFGVVDLNNFESENSIGILQEFVGDGTTLHNFFRQKPNIGKSDWISIAFQLAHGLEKFHAKKILLNDIKSNNIVMYTRRGGIRVKYIDFGLATYISGRRYNATRDELHKLQHLAPEVQDGYYTSRASDVYSLGRVLRQIHKFGDIKDLLLISLMCMRESPKVRLTAHTTKLLIENTVNF